MIRMNYHIKKLLLYLIFILGLLPLNSIFASREVIAGKHKIDSLLKKLPLVKSNERIDILINLSNQYLSFSLDSADGYARLALESAREINDKSSIAEAYNMLGIINQNIGDYSKSDEYFLKALTISEKLGISKTSQSILNNLGLSSQVKGNYDKSLKYYFKSIEIGKKIGNLKVISDTYNNIGKIYLETDNYQKALDFFFKSLDSDKNLGTERSNTLNNIGKAYIQLDYYKEALKYLKQAQKIATANNQYKELADIYKNFAIACEYAGMYDKAYSNYQLYKLYDDSIKKQKYNNKLKKAQIRLEVEQKEKEIERLNTENKLVVKQKDYEIQIKNYVIYSFIIGLIVVLFFAFALLMLYRQKKKANTLLRKQNEDILRADKIIEDINKSLNESEDRFRRIVLEMPVMIDAFDKTGLIVFWNKECERITGYTADEMIGNPDAMKLLYPGNNKKKSVEKDTENFGISYREQETELTCKDGSTKIISWSSVTFTAPIKGWRDWAVGIDVTQRRKAEKVLKQAKSDAEKSDKLKTVFLANMSHEIRTPMNSIIGFANLLAEPEIDMQKKDEYLDHIIQSSNSLLNLINDIIDISKIESGQLNTKKERCHISTIMKTLLSSFSESRKEDISNVELRLNLPANHENHYCYTDPLRFQQILSNLIGNAIKFTEQGYIEIGYIAGKKQDKSFLEFYIKDTGIGIPKDKLDLVFDRFRQIDDSHTKKHSGTGLGLTISKRLVELLGGTITVDSTIDKGSTFYFTLPFEMAEKKVSQEPKLFNSSDYNWEDKTILIAEDENSNYELLKASISKTNITIIRAMNGEEAVNIVKKNDGIDIILMDIRMPKMDGYEATQLIKSFKKDLPIISITAFAMSEDESKSLEAGCDMYISKPIRPGKILSMIDGFIK